MVITAGAAQGGRPLIKYMDKILAIDDETTMTDFYEDLFSGAGYEIKTAADATAGMDMYYDFKPDLLVLDADMPGGGGERVFGISRTLLNSDIPIVFITGLPERVAKLALTNSNVRVYQKPVDTNDLLSTVKEMIKARKSK